MVPAGNKAKRLSSVNHTTKTIHHHHIHLNSSDINVYSQYLLRCIMYYLLRYYKDQTQLVGLFFKKDVREFVA